MKKTSTTKYETAVPTSRKVWGVLALAGLFTCGVFIGTTLNNNRTPDTEFSDDACRELADKIAGETDEATLEQLGETYSEHCTVAASDQNTTNLSRCQWFEEMLSTRLCSDDTLKSNSINYSCLEQNIGIYNKLVTYGCPENRDKYVEILGNQASLLKLMFGESVLDTDKLSTCERIEQLLTGPLGGADTNDPDEHLYKAEIYARLAERGCPENADKYRALAASEIEITTALRPVEDMSDSDVADVVDVYKKVKMQAAAQQVIDTLQKVSEPTIDFILKLEKIVNEE